MKILCAIDGSRYSRWALEALQRVERPSESSVELLHVINTGPLRLQKTMSPETKQAVRDGLALAESRGKALLIRAERTVSRQATLLHGQVVKGRPSHAIVRFARRRQCDLIVMGCRGLNELRPFLLGSVSRHVVMDAPCSVLIVKRRLKAVHRVLVGVDGSKDSRGAIDLLIRLMHSKDMHATVVSVVPPLPLEAGIVPQALLTLLSEVQRPLEEEARATAERSADRLRQAGIEADILVLHGHIGRELVELARRSSADLMVIGSRGLTGATRYLMGSVADTVVKYAPCPVLVFRHA